MKHKFKVGDKEEKKSKKNLASEDLQDCRKYCLDGLEKHYKQYLKDMKNRKYSNECKILVVDDIKWSLDEQIKYHEEQLAKLKAQKEKEKWVFTEDEKVILRNIDKQYKWLGRDVEGTLWFYDTKPVCPIGYGKAKYIDLFNHLFRCIKIQDEPCEFRKYI